MGAVVEVKYFNSFVLKKTVQTQNQPVWNGSFGIPQENGGYPVVADTSQNNNWAIEEARIRGGYNNTNVDYGVKAYLVEEEPNSSIRFNSLIWSGIFNSRTGINPADGSIQKLYAEDTNLTIFQERKVSRALIDKDAIYSAEGTSSVTSTNLVIGVIQPYAGRFGISRNPESFAVYGFNKFFSDKNNNVILRLGKNGITEISASGMKDYFRDQLNAIDNPGGAEGYVRGGYDIYNNKYIVSTQQNIPNPSYNTLSWSDSIGGWTSFFSYRPDQLFSIRNNFYTVQNGSLYRHHDSGVNRGQFYGVDTPSLITFIFNPSPTVSKTFKTVSYEGSNGWKVISFASDGTGQDFDLPGNFWVTNEDVTTIPNNLDLYAPTSVHSYLEGEYVINPADGQPVVRQDYLATFGTIRPALNKEYAGFNRKENSYASNLINYSTPESGEVISGEQVAGVKGYYSTVTFLTDAVTNVGAEKQLFAVSSEFTQNNGY
jgi:hypothetical protein